MANEKRTFGSGDRVSFELNADTGLMRFFRDDEHIEGADIEGVPMDKDLHVVGKSHCTDRRVQTAFNSCVCRANPTTSWPF